MITYKKQCNKNTPLYSICHDYKLFDNESSAEVNYFSCLKCGKQYFSHVPKFKESKGRGE